MNLENNMFTSASTIAVGITALQSTPPIFHEYTHEEGFPHK